jgi:hypothetical protein
MIRDLFSQRYRPGMYGVEATMGCIGVRWWVPFSVRRAARRREEMGVS